MEMIEFVNTVNSHIASDTGSKENVMRFVMDVSAPLQERGKVKEIYNLNLSDCHLVDVSDIWDFAYKHVAPTMFNYRADAERESSFITQKFSHPPTHPNTQPPTRKSIREAT